MDGKHKKIIDELFIYAKETMDKLHIFPYVSFIVKNEQIIAKGYNMATVSKLPYAGDITRQGDVMAVRNAQDKLKTSDLSGYTLISFMEPTILGFDIALWAGINSFIWLINKDSAPSHYTNISYSPLNYAEKHSDIIIKHGVREEEALKLLRYAEDNNFYPQ